MGGGQAAVHGNPAGLRQADQAKNAFVADVTHELRTPLTVIKGNVGLMRRLGMGKIAQRFTGRSQRKDSPTGTISWDDIELLSADQPMRLRVSSDRINDLHPADLAEIISDLRGSAAYKRELLRVYIGRAVRLAASGDKQ